MYGMKTTLLRNLLTAVACLFGIVSAQAQFSSSLEIREGKYFDEVPVDFPLSEVAAALGTDAATFAADYEAWQGAEEGTWEKGNLLFLDTPADGLTDQYTCDGNGFFMLQDGGLASWNNDGVWYTYAVADLEGGLLTFFVAQSNALGEGFTTLTAGQQAKANLVLKYNEKEVTFEITLNVTEKPSYEVPEPATLVETLLNVVSEKEVTVHQFPRGGYDSDEVKVDFADALEALGIPSNEVLVDEMGQLIYAPVYNDGDVEEGGGMKKDTLSNQYTANAPGFWFRPVQDENGEENGECASSGWGDTDKFFVESFSYDAENDSLVCRLGQYPGVLKGEESWYANIYLIWGDKACRIRYTIVVDQREQGNGLAGMNKVGEETVTVEQEPTTDYSTKAVQPDLEAIAEALGCETAAIGWVALDDTDNFAGSTANNGGFWFSAAGTVTSWGASAAIFVEPATNGDYSTLNVGQYPNALAVDDEVSASVYFVNGDNYYTYTVNLKIIQPEFVEQDFKSVAERTFSVQTLVRNAYDCDQTWTMPVEDIEAILGTSSPTLYGLTIDSIADVQGKYSNKYSCDPKPGFWLNTEGEVSVWGDANARVGISFLSDGTFQFFQHPNRNSLGDIFKTQLFLVNEGTNEMITFNISVRFVESLEEKEVVASEDVVFGVSEDETGYQIDLSRAAEALGVSVEDLVAEENNYLRGLTTSGIYGEHCNCSNGLSFDLDGGYNSYGNLYFTIDPDGMLTIACYEEIDETYDVRAQFCFEVGDKQYVYYARFVSQTIYEEIRTGVESIDGEKAEGQVYDLSGRKVEKPVRGLYIQQGRKFIVK